MRQYLPAKVDRLRGLVAEIGLLRSCRRICPRRIRSSSAGSACASTGIQQLFHLLET